MREELFAQERALGAAALTNVPLYFAMLNASVSMPLTMRAPS